VKLFLVFTTNHWYATTTRRIRTQTQSTVPTSSTVDFTSLRTCVSVMRERKREACSESCGNNLITRTLMHHACSKQSEINSITADCVSVQNFAYSVMVFIQSISRTYNANRVT